MEHAQRTEVWAIYTDGTEDGRRVRHVHAVKNTLEEAKDAVRWYADLGVTMATKRFASEAEAHAYEIEGDDEEFDALDRLHLIDAYYSDVAS